MIWNTNDFKERVLGCWMGKNIGGTLGAPMEWRRQVNEVSFYTQEHKGEPLPNDDLDIQLLWLIALEEQGLALDERVLGDYWMAYVTPHWAEYGNAKVNMRSGLVPPLSGALNNVYKHSCGAFIRSEIWACMCAGNPALAARYAVMDACIDHGCGGEGAYAAVFTAAMEAAAFVEDDVRTLIDIGLSYTPEGCDVRGAVLTAMAAYDGGRTWLEARDDVLSRYASAPFFNNPDTVSPDDTRKGFNDGPFGWEVPANMGMLIIGLLYGEGDFDKTLCITVNCGEDTDCTGATVGSIFGILHGAAGIPARWMTPIGRGIKTVAINLGDLQGRVPENIDELTERTVRMAQQAALRYPGAASFSDANVTDKSGIDAAALRGEAVRSMLYARGPVFRFSHYEVELIYPNGPFAAPGQRLAIELCVRHTHGVQGRVDVTLMPPPGFVIEGPSHRQGFITPAHWGMGQRCFAFTLLAEETPPARAYACAVITIDGRANAMTLPIAILGGEERAACDES